MSERATHAPEISVIVGVDTHKHVHVAVAIDSRGARLGDCSVPADSGGYQALIIWAEAQGGSRRLVSRAPAAMARGSRERCVAGGIASWK